MKTILTVAAHPDDEILGCGGTISRLTDEGYDAYTMILGEGVTSRDDVRDRNKRESEIQELKKQVIEANKKIGVKKIFIFNFPDNRFDVVPLLDIVKKVETIKNKIKPDIIFTHFKNDLNIDHKKTYEAVLTATRPMENETVKTIYSFEILSSTEWNYPTTFSPNVFFDITNSLDKKIQAVEKYESEIRSFPHPRSSKTIGVNASKWGSFIGKKYAEAFMLIRDIK